MNVTVLVALTFAALAALEWQYRLRIVRLATALLALAVLALSQPAFTATARRVSVAPPQERITEHFGTPTSEYESGVRTLYEAIREDQMVHADVRLITLGVLFWLACSPVLRGVRGPSIGGARDARRVTGVDNQVPRPPD